MPSPLGHTLAALALAPWLPGGHRHDGWWLVAVAAAPDLDLLPGLARRRPNAYHGAASHSLGAALLVGAAAGMAAQARGRRFAPNAARATAAYASHLALDLLSKEAGEGLPLLWPASSRRFAAPRSLFLTLRSRRRRYFRGLLQPHNARALGREVLVLGPLWLASRALRRRTEGRRRLEKR